MLSTAYIHNSFNILKLNFENCPGAFQVSSIFIAGSLSKIRASFRHESQESSLEQAQEIHLLAVHCEIVYFHSDHRAAFLTSYIFFKLHTVTKH